MKEARFDLSHRLQGWGAAIFFGVFRMLPIEWASATGGALARGIGPLLGVSKRARLNLRRAFPEISDAELARLTQMMWDNLGRVAAEYPHLREIRVFEPGGRVETHGLEHIDRAIAAGRRMIIFSGHIANWEIAMLAAPDELRSDFDEFVASLKQQRDLTRQISTAAGQNDTAKIQQIGTQAEKAQSEYRRLSDKIGFKECGGGN